MDDLLEARYKAQVLPELYPDTPQPRLENWHPEDLEAYCGGEYAVRGYFKHFKPRLVMGADW